MADLDSMYTVAQTINYECYLDNQKFLGTASIDLPEITYQTQDISGAGLGGTVNYPSLWLTDSLTTTLHWRSMTPHTSDLAEQKKLDIQMYSAVNRYKNSDGTLEPLAIAINIRGLAKKTGVGKFQPNELMDSETEIEIIRLEIKINNVEKYLIDKVGYQFKINGVDYLADVKNILDNGYLTT